MNEELLPAQKKKDGKAEVVPMEEKERSDEASRLARFIQMHDLQQVRAVRKRMMVERERETASEGI